MNDAVQLTAVKTFLSYSWTTPAHEKWVLDLASRLRTDGVDIILDKWDLKPGHDSYKFMEQMVTDSSVKKVIMICDHKYAEKADARSGGVGVESQIISPALYSKAEQDKFAAVITEYHEDGRACVPTFYKGRIYFDFSRDEDYEEQYEALLRWIVDRPQHVKPKLGVVPRHIADGKVVQLSTESKFRRANEAIRQAAPRAEGLLREFCGTFADEFGMLRIVREDGVEFDDQVIEAIKSARPYLDQLFQVMTSICRFTQGQACVERIARLLEQMAGYMYRPENVRSYNDEDFDNFKFLSHASFLGCLAIALQEERFDLASSLLGRRYMIDNTAAQAGGSRGYEVYWQPVRSLVYRNQRLGTNRSSLHADLLKELFSHGEPTFESLMQADFVAYLRDTILSSGDVFSRWHPVTLLYASSRYRPFEIFARSESLAYFKNLMPLLGVSSVEDFRAKLTEGLKNRRQPYPYGGGHVGELLGGNDLGKFS